MVAVLVTVTAPPVTTPVDPTTAATNGALLLHVPDGVASVKVVVKPAHTTSIPLIEPGNGFTVTTTAVKQPVGNLYVMIAVPEVPVPVTNPLVKPTPAVPDALLLQVPNGVASLNWVVSPEQTLSVPVIAAGNGLTVTTAVITQDVGKV